MERPSSGLAYWRFSRKRQIGNGYSHKMNFYPNYHAAEDDELFLIEGSCSTLEISLRNGNANDKLNVETGTRIEIL
ncbi:MAG: SAM hydroxide adenosyltransferase [Planctomycetota bacterium]|jgi:S-adenosylmethionine hydrolase